MKITVNASASTSFQLLRIGGVFIFADARGFPVPHARVKVSETACANLGGVGELFRVDADRAVVPAVTCTLDF